MRDNDAAEKLYCGAPNMVACLGAPAIAGSLINPLSDKGKELFPATDERKPKKFYVITSAAALNRLPIFKLRYL
jgi:hypothetical protein